MRVEARVVERARRGFGGNAFFFLRERLSRSAAARPAAVAVAKNAAASGSASARSTRAAAHAQSVFARFLGGNNRDASDAKTRAAAASDDTASPWWTTRSATP